MNDLAEIEKVIPGIKLDIKYSTADNFTGRVLYPIEIAYLIKEVTKDLLEAQEEFNKQGSCILNMGCLQAIFSY